MNIYSSSLRLFKIVLVINLLSATHGQYVIFVLSLPLRWLRVTFVLNTLIALRVIIHAQPRPRAFYLSLIVSFDGVGRAEE